MAPKALGDNLTKREWPQAASRTTEPAAAGWGAFRALAVGDGSQDGHVMVDSTSSPVPWMGALSRFARLVQHVGAEWMLVGSAATAVRGVDLVPGDLDALVRAALDVESIAAVMPSSDDDDGNADPASFLSSTARPVLRFANGRWALGRWHLGGVEVEVAHIHSAGRERDRLIETAGDRIWRKRESVDLLGSRIPIVPLEVQIATMVVRAQDERLLRVMRVVAETGLRQDLLREALRDRGFKDGTALPAPIRSFLAR